MTNPIPISVRGGLYVLGIIVGSLVTVALPDLLVALKAGPDWTTFAVRFVGALTVLLSTLGRSNLGDPVPAAQVTVINQSAADDAQDGTTEGTQGAPAIDATAVAEALTAEPGTDADGVDWEPAPAA